MSKPASLRRRLGLAGMAVPLLLAGGLSGCSAQYTAATAASYVPGQGTFANSGSLKVRAIVVVSQTTGSGAVTAVLVNDGDSDDTLTGVTVGGAKVALTPSTVPIPAHSMVKLGIPASGDAAAAAKEQPTAFVTGSNISAGGTADVSFSFNDTPTVTATSMILANTGEYAEIPLPAAG